MIRYAIREVRLESGERLPLLVHGDPLGLPVPEIVEYSIAKLRAHGLRRRSIHHRAEALGLYAPQRREILKGQKGLN